MLTKLYTVFVIKSFALHLTKNPVLRLTLFVFCIALASNSHAQSVIAAAGSYDRNSIASLEWTVGETFVETTAASNNIYTQGFHQSLLIKSTKPIIPFVNNQSNFQFQIAPNPVISELTVMIDNKITTKVQVQLADAFGRTIKLFSPSYNRSFKLSLVSQPAGNYYLFIKNDKNELLKSFTIIKAN